MTGGGLFLRSGGCLRDLKRWMMYGAIRTPMRQAIRGLQQGYGVGGVLQARGQLAQVGGGDAVRVAESRK